jgi:hypothetical protein
LRDLEAIDAIDELDPFVPRSVSMGTSGSGPPAVPEGEMGRATPAPKPVAAAQQAVDRGIRVYAVGFGTEDPGGRPPSTAIAAVVICLAILLGQAWRPLP